MHKGTEAVEGGVEMDASGEGFVNMGMVKVSLGNNPNCNVAAHHQCHLIFLQYFDHMHESEKSLLTLVRVVLSLLV